MVLVQYAQCTRVQSEGAVLQTGRIPDECLATRGLRGKFLKKVLTNMTDW
jgi:hypothetical protein